MIQYISILQILPVVKLFLKIFPKKANLRKWLYYTFSWKF